MQTLRELYLANNKLFFTPITPAIGQLKALTRLDLSGNQLEEIPPELGYCSALEFLDLRFVCIYLFVLSPHLVLLLIVPKYINLTIQQ